MTKLRLMVLLLLTLPVLGQNKNNLSSEVLYTKCEPSVVTILTFDSKRAPLGQGSGFIVARNRVTTNFHVMKDSTSASVIFSDGSISVVTGVIAGSAPKDLIVLEAETGNRPALALGDELKLKIGETIYAIGSPEGLSTSLSSGLVSAFRQDEGQFLIQITAAVAPGSSGGPLLNSQGQVVGVTTSRLKEGGFGFAMGVGDVRHLLKVPLAVKMQLADLNGDTASSNGDELEPVRHLFDQKKFDEARDSFIALPATTKRSFEGLVLLCKIEQERKSYDVAIEACNKASQLSPTSGTPYELNAFSYFQLRANDKAETAALKASQLSNDIEIKNFLGLIYYLEEKYAQALNVLSAESDDPLVRSLRAGAAYHTGNYDLFRRTLTQISSAKGSNNGWSLFMDGIAAERDLNWDVAADKFRKCDADKDFLDSVCIQRVLRTEIMRGNYSTVKSDLQLALSRYPSNGAILSEGVFFNLLVGNTQEADRLHAAMQSAGVNEDSSDCLYYYGRNQPKLASSHCEAAVRKYENNYSSWSNAGYVALDNGDFQTAVSYFAKAFQLYYDSKEKHTVTQDLDVSWGVLLAEYYSGDKKGAKKVHGFLKKQYPQFMTTTALKQLSLVWSDSTVRLLDQAMKELK